MPFTRYADRLDTIIYREYDSLAPAAVRTLLWANTTLGADFLPEIQTEYDAPPIDSSLTFTPQTGEIERLRGLLDG